MDWSPLFSLSGALLLNKAVGFLGVCLLSIPPISALSQKLKSDWWDKKQRQKNTDGANLEVVKFAEALKISFRTLADSLEAKSYRKMYFGLILAIVTAFFELVANGLTVFRVIPSG